jgi:short-subunit dehydrogenase
MSNTNCGRALITGASSGIGAVYADRLARQGYDLILVARNAARLRALDLKISGETGRKVETIQADLTVPADLRKIEQVLKTDTRITLLVNNAGIAAITPLLQSDVEKMEQMVALNVTAPMRLAYAAVPCFVARGNGTLINIASIVAVAPEQLNGVYGGSKAFMLAFSQSLRHELADKGVRVQAVLPGATATELWERSGKPIEELPPSIVMSTADMVDAALAGLAAGEFVTLPSLPEQADWNAYEKARQNLRPNLSRATPAARYGIAHTN